MILKNLESFAEYDSVNGGFVVTYKRYNAAKGIGKPLGTVKGGGAVAVGLLGRSFHIHHLVWLWHYGKLPKFLDHKNQIKTDNRLVNLREVTASINARNRPLRSDNKYGYTGVSFDDSGGTLKPWRARVNTDNGRTITIGRYPSFEEAVIAKENYLQNVKLGYTELHGV